MMTYSDRSVAIALECDVVVAVCLNEDNTDCEFCPVKPRPTAASELMPRDEFVSRRLRNVGVVGLSGLTPRLAFKEPIESCVVDAISEAFLGYVNALLAKKLAVQAEMAEIMELEHLYMLRDERLSN